MRKHIRILLMSGVSLVFVIFICLSAFVGCATLQIEPVKEPAIHEVVLQGDNMVELTFNAPATWPSTEEFTAPDLAREILFFRYPGLCVYKTEVNGSYYNILIDMRQEPVEAICLSDSVADKHEWHWYLFKKGMPVEVSRVVARLFINIAERRGPAEQPI